MLKAFLILFVLFAMLESKADVQVNYLKLSNFTKEETAKVNKTAKVIEAVLNSKEFKVRVLNHSWENKKQFVDTTMSNEQVYEKLMKGVEAKYSPKENGNVDIGLEMYYSAKNTIGYTYPDSDTIWLNRKFHNGYDEYDQPSNIVHEWTHKLGFAHASKWSKSRDYSVPYGIGQIVEELAAELKKDKNSLNPVTEKVEPEIKPVPEVKPVPAVKPVPEVKPIPVPEVKPIPKKLVCSRSWRNWFRKVCIEK